MTTEARIAAVAAAALASGCASTSARRDLARVEELARIPLPVAAAGARVDPEPDPEVRELLSKPLMADSAVRIALLQNRDLRAALRDVAAARGRAAQAGTLPNPAVEFDLRQSTRGDSPLQQDYFVEYDLTRALLTPLRSGAAEADVGVERLRVAGLAVDLGYRARTAFFAFEAAQQRLALANRTLDALAAGREASLALLRAGNVRELDAAAQEAAYEAGRATVADVELDMIERREELQRLLGLHGAATSWTTNPELPEPQEPGALDDIEASAVRSSLELAEVRMRLEAIARRTGLARAEGWIPDVTIDAHAEQDDSAWEIGGGAKITIPLFDRRQGTTAAHEAEFDALLERYHGTAADIRSAAREARARLEVAFRRARHYRSVVVPARQRVVDHAVRQFNAMAIDVFQLLRFQRELLDAELAAVDALRDYWITRAGVDAIAAGVRTTATARPAARAPVSAAAAEGGH